MQFSKVGGTGSAVTGYYFDTGTGIETRYTVPHNLSKQDLGHIDVNTAITDMFWEKLSEKYKLLDVDAAFAQAVRGGEPYDALCVSLKADKAVSYSAFMNVIHEVERGINKSIMTGWDFGPKEKGMETENKQNADKKDENGCCASLTKPCDFKDAVDALGAAKEEITRA